MRLGILKALALVTLLLLWLPSLASAGDSTEVQLAEALSEPGMVAIIVGAVAMPLLEGDDNAGDEALRTADGIASAWLVTKGLQRSVQEERPDGTSKDSFPSGHATSAFAAATMAADRHPKQAPYWYGAAAAIAWSRVRLKRHHTRDVLAGAAIGYGMAKLEQQLPRGLLIAPFYDPDTQCGGVEACWEF